MDDEESNSACEFGKCSDIVSDVNDSAEESSSESTTTQNNTDFSVGSCSGDFECFRNFSAPEVLVQGLANSVSKEDISSIINSQRVMLQRLEKSSALLNDCNRQAEQRFQTSSAAFKKHVAVLLDLKKELHLLSNRISKYRTKIVNQYPQHYKRAVANSNITPDEDGEDAVNSTMESTTPSTTNYTTISTTTDAPTMPSVIAESGETRCLKNTQQMSPVCSSRVSSENQHQMAVSVDSGEDQPSSSSSSCSAAL